METNKKIASQENLVDMLTAFGRGALGTLTDRFNQYDAAVEAVATHDTVIEKLTRNKAEWFDAGYITEATCYNIVTGAQQSVTLPLDVSELLNRFRAVASRTRLYTGVRFTVQDNEGVSLYLKFAAVSPYADSGAVVFEDLQFCYSPTEEGIEDIDVRYKVRTDKSTGHIVLEKMEESAGAAPQEWVIPTLDAQDMAEYAQCGNYAQPNYLYFDASKAKIGDIVKVADDDAVIFTIIGTAVYKIPIGTTTLEFPVFYLFDGGGHNRSMCIYSAVFAQTYGYFQTRFYEKSYVTATYLASYAKKTDIPEKPFTFYLDGDVLGYDPDDYASGINFKLQIPTTISTNLNTCRKQYLERTSNAAGTAASITSEDPGTKLPQFYLLFGNGDSAFRFQCDGVHQSGSALYFHGEIRNTSNYAYYDAYWVQGDSYIVFRKVSNIYFASGGGVE